jgi:hypothetical protein
MLGCGEIFHKRRVTAAAGAKHSPDEDHKIRFSYSPAPCSFLREKAETLHPSLQHPLSRRGRVREGENCLHSMARLLFKKESSW